MPRVFSEAVRNKRALNQLIKFLQSPKVEVRHLEIKNHIDSVIIDSYIPHHMDTGFRTVTLQIYQKPKRRYKRKPSGKTTRRKP